MPKNKTSKKRQKRQMKGGADDQENSRRENCMKDVPKLFLAFFRQTIDPNSRRIPKAKGCEKNINLQYIANNIEEIAANQ